MTKKKKNHIQAPMFSTGRRPGSDGGETDDAATTDGGRPAMAGAGGELHGIQTLQTFIHKLLLSLYLCLSLLYY